MVTTEQGWKESWGTINWNGEERVVLGKVKDLIAKGFDVNATDKNGQVPLMAAHRGHEAVVHTLCDAGADVNKQNSEGMTALMDGALTGSELTIKALLERGADPLIRDKDGKRALNYAIGRHLKTLLRDYKQVRADYLRRHTSKAEVDKNVLKAVSERTGRL